MSIAYKVIDFRPVTLEGVIAFFNVAFGVEDEAGDFVGLFTVRDFALKQKRDGTGLTIQSPYRKMTNKDGSPLLDATTGKPRYSDYFDLYKVAGAGKDGKYGATDAAWKFRNSLTAEVVKVYEANSGKPAAKQPVATKATVGESSKGTPFDDFDDDLAF